MVEHFPSSSFDSVPRRRSLFAIAAIAAVLIALLPAWNVPARAAATYYVSPSGSDANPGTLASPWRTLGKSMKALRPGDTLLVRGGTYLERITSVAFTPGTPSAHVLVKAYPGERPVLKGLLWLRDIDYWTVDGLNATWDPATGQPAEHLVKIMNGVGWTFTHAEVWGARSYSNLIVGTTVSGEPAGWRISDSCFHDTYAAHAPFQDHNLYIASGLASGPGVVERNVFYNASNGENIKVGGSSSTADGTARVTIRNNTLYNASTNALIAWRSAQVTVERNLLGKSTGKWWYPNLRGYEVSGSGNIARDNAGFAASKFLLNTDSSTGIKDGGGNVFPLDPAFDVASCTGFHPKNAAARMYGRWAPSGVPVSGDWDGDGTQTSGFVRGNVWYLNDGFDDSPEHVFAFGSASDRKIAGDWNGDGVATPGIVRGNVWYLNNGFDPYADVTFAYGSSTDKPVVGDWDGNGTYTPGIVRGNVWHVNNGLDPNADSSFAYGVSSDTFIPGDWDGNGTTTPGIVRGNVWHINNGLDGYADTSFGYGLSSDVPVAGDWDGDGDTSAAIIRGADWYLLNANAGGSPDVIFSDAAWLG